MDLSQGQFLLLLKNTTHQQKKLFINLNQHSTLFDHHIDKKYFILNEQTFAVMGGLYAGVSCFMKRLRQKEDGTAILYLFYIFYVTQNMETINKFSLSTFNTRSLEWSSFRLRHRTCLGLVQRPLVSPPELCNAWRLFFLR